LDSINYAHIFFGYVSNHGVITKKFLYYQELRLTMGYHKGYDVDIKELLTGLR
jgi:hypothetical protein